MMPVNLICQFPRTNSILLMLVSVHVMGSLFRIGVFATILQNGVVLLSGEYYTCSFCPCSQLNRTDQLNRPVNREELYNLRHSSARNAVERIFGILKRRFTILDSPPEYSMTIQARIPPALAAVHNFIRIHDKDEIHEFEDVLEDRDPQDQDYGELARGPTGRAEKARAEIKRDTIAQAMWISYQELVREEI
jgi:hypothetical protein